jgi:hypothetical protein
MGLFRRHADAVVAELTWRRTVQIANVEWVPVRSTSPPPPTARNVRATYEQVWVDVQDGVDSNGMPGTSRELRSRKVYVFEDQQWTPVRVLAAEGTGQSGVHWPEYELGLSEAVGKRSEWYLAVFKLVDSGKELKADIDEANWRTMEKGSRYRLKLGIFGDIRWMAPATG